MQGRVPVKSEVMPYAPPPAPAPFLHQNPPPPQPPTPRPLSSPCPTIAGSRWSVPRSAVMAKSTSCTNKHVHGKTTCQYGCTMRPPVWHAAACWPVDACSDKGHCTMHGLVQNHKPTPPTLTQKAASAVRTAQCMQYLRSAAVITSTPHPPTPTSHLTNPRIALPRFHVGLTPSKPAPLAEPASPAPAAH
jgi:hypothetical protein